MKRTVALLLCAVLMLPAVAEIPEILQPFLDYSSVFDIYNPENADGEPGREEILLRLLSEIEKCFPDKRYELFTSTRSKDNIRLYEKNGYTAFTSKNINDKLEFVYLEKC